MEVINAIKHYQRNIEKCSGNEERMLHCLHKLYRLPVTVQHLQETGIGRTVNALRKYEGDAGEAAKALVNKWKAMVAEADSEEDVADEKPPSRTESPPKNSSHRPKSSNSESHKEVNHKEKYRSKEKGSSSSNHRDKSKDEKSSSKTKHMDHGHKRRHDEEGRKDEEKRRRKNVNIEDDSDAEEEEQICNGQDSSEENEESDKTSEDESNREEDEPEEASNSEEEVKQDDSDSSEEEQTPIVHVKHKSGDCDNRHSSSSSHSKSNTHSSHRSKNNREDHKSEKSRDKSHHSTDHRRSVNTDARGSSSSKADNRNSSVHSNKETEVRSKDKGRPREKEKNKEKERVKIVEKTKDKFEDIKDNSRTVEQKEKRRDDKRERSKTEERKDKVKSGERAERQKTDEKVRDTKDKKADETRKSHSSNENPKSRSSSSKSSSSKIDKNKISNSKQANASVDGVEDGIDSFSGTSFADALGMMGAMDTVVKKKKKVASSSSSNSKKAEGSSVHKGRNSSSNAEKPIESTSQKSSPLAKLTRSTDDVNLLDPSLQLEPLDEIEMEVDVDATLPAINPNYRPLPHFNFDMPSRARVKALSEEEALSQVMSTKNQRTKVYSGVKTNKSWSTVPSLFDICVRVLQENIDALEYTGGVPYDLLRPVLIQASPEQLFTLEHYNPYLVEDTDELWQAHVKKKFRNKSRLDMETYREMYQRCVEESEAKLKALTQNIQNSMAKSLPVRQTKLAYVDSMAKPPRQVAKKQAKFGTANATPVTPMAKVQKLASPSSANSSTSPVIHVPAPRSSQSAKVKPRMAPLMQKTMKLAKSFKR